MWRKLTLVLFVLLLASPLLQAQLTSSPATLAQSSTPTSEMPNGLWEPLLEQIQSLPLDFDNYQATLTAQVNSLKINNKSLIASNQSLTINNESLTESLKQSEIRAATSEAKSKQLQTDLDASTLSITQAQNDAKALELQNGILKIGCWSFGIGLAGVGVYEAGHHDWTLGPIQFKKLW